MDETWRSELSEFIAIPSVSADPAHREDVKRAGEWVCDFIRRIGGTAELTPSGEKELALGDIPASTDPESAPTVLCYGHFDVQPPAPLDRWESDPFELTIKDDWAYARGIADDKGQFTAYGEDRTGIKERLRNDDGIHFTAAGYELIAERVISLLPSLQADGR